MSDTWLSYVCHLKGEHSKTVWSLYHHCVTFREPPKSSVTLNGGVVGSKGCLFYFDVSIVSTVWVKVQTPKADVRQLAQLQNSFGARRI